MLTQKRYLYAKENNICTCCGEKEATHGRLCEPCRKNKLEYDRRLRARRNFSGLCQRCGQDDATIGVFCKSCKEKVTNYSTTRTRELKEKGLCIQCGKEHAVPSQILCLNCKEKNKARRERKLHR